MGAWGKDRGAGDKVRLLADGNGDFAKALGLDFDGSNFGMGVRSQRYAVSIQCRSSALRSAGHLHREIPTAP